MASISATFDQVNHYQWQRQGFARAARRAGGDLFTDVFGIYATAPTCYLSLLARRADFRFVDLPQAVEELHQAVRIRGMRYSNFIIPVGLLPAVFQAVKRDPENPIKQMRLLGITDAEYEQAAEAVLQLIAGRTMTASEIRKALPAGLVERFGGALSYLHPQMCADGRLVRARVRGGWKSNVYEYAAWRDWLPGVDLDSISRQDGQVILTRLYFDCYGPATVADLQWWSGMSKPDTSRAIAALGNELTIIQVGGAEHLMLVSQVESTNDAGEPYGVRLLPAWDAYLMAYRERERYLHPGHAGFVFDRAGNATSVLLINGKVGGVWDMVEDKKTLVLKAVLFEPMDSLVWRQLNDEAIRLANAAGFSSLHVLRCASAPILREGGQNLFLSPLKDVPGETVVEIAI